MSDDNGSDLTKLDDDALISQRSDAREKLERLSPHAANRATLVQLFRVLDDEFYRRARAAWSEATQ